VQVSNYTLYMITSEEYPTFCAGGKCAFPSRKAIHHTDFVNNRDYNDNYNEVYGDDLSKHERFRDLGIPIFILQLKPKTCNHVLENEDGNETSVISNEMFDELYNLVADSHKKKTTNNSKKKKENKGSNTRKRKKKKN